MCFSSILCIFIKRNQGAMVYYINKWQEPDQEKHCPVNLSEPSVSGYYRLLKFCLH